MIVNELSIFKNSNSLDEHRIKDCCVTYLLHGNIL